MKMSHRIHFSVTKNTVFWRKWQKITVSVKNVCDKLKKQKQKQKQKTKTKTKTKKQKQLLVQLKMVKWLETNKNGFFDGHIIPIPEMYTFIYITVIIRKLQRTIFFTISG